MSKNFKSKVNQFLHKNFIGVIYIHPNTSNINVEENQTLFYINLLKSAI